MGGGGALLQSEYFMLSFSQDRRPIIALAVTSAAEEATSGHTSCQSLSGLFSFFEELCLPLLCDSGTTHSKIL